MVGQEKKTVKQKMYDLLSDGYLHSVEELRQCLEDEFAPLETVAVHISTLREELSRFALGIAVKKEDSLIYYQLIRFIRRS